MALKEILVTAFDFWNLDENRGVKRQQLGNIEQDNSWMQKITLSNGRIVGYFGAKYGRLQIDQIKTVNDLDHGGGSAEVAKR